MPGFKGTDRVVWLCWCLVLLPLSCAVRWGATQVAPDASALAGHAICDRHLLMFGGFGGSDASYTNTLHQFDLRTRSWVKLHTTGDPPGPRVGAKLFCVNNTLFAVGGDSLYQRHLAEIYMIPLDTLKWQKVMVRFTADIMHPAILHRPLRSGSDGVRIGSRLIGVAQLSDHNVGEINVKAIMNALRNGSHQALTRPDGFSGATVEPEIPEGNWHLRQLSNLEPIEYCVGGFRSTQQVSTNLLPGTRFAILLGGKSGTAGEGFVDVPVLLHLDSLRACRLPVEGLQPSLRLGGVSTQIVRIPVHVTKRVTTVEGHTLYGDGSAPLPSEFDPTKVHKTIVEWRTMLVMAFGCGPVGEAEGGFCPAPNGPEGGSVYALDLTPLYRHMPSYVQLGLDPRMAPSGEGETSSRASDGFGDQIPYPDEQSGPAPEWEAWVLNVLPNDTWPRFQCTKETQFESVRLCNTSEPLRWRRLYSAGRHVLWEADGLSVQVPSQDTPSSYWVTNKSVPLLEKTLVPRTQVPNATVDRTSSSPFLDYLGTENLVADSSSEVDLCEEGIPVGRLLRYPILTSVMSADKQTSGSFGLQFFISSAIGSSGKTGHLGTSSILFFGGEINIQGRRGTSVLELWGSLHAHHAAALNLTSSSKGATGPLAPDVSAAVDEHLFLWGLWSSPGDQQGIPSPAIYGQASVEVPASEFGLPSVQEIVPGHPCKDACASSLPEYPPSTVASYSLPSWPWFNENCQLSIVTAVESWKSVVRAGAFGSSAVGYELALRDPGGFARWSGVSSRVWSSIEEELKSETLMVLISGCRGKRTDISQIALCIDYTTKLDITSDPTAIIPFLQKAFSLHAEDVYVLHPETGQWWPQRLHRIPPLSASERRIMGHAFLFREGLLLFPGTQVNVASISSDGLSINRKTILHMDFNDRTWTNVPITSMLEASTILDDWWLPLLSSASMVTPYASAPLPHEALDVSLSGSAEVSCPTFVPEFLCSHEEVSEGLRVMKRVGTLLGCFLLHGGGRLADTETALTGFDFDIFEPVATSSLVSFYEGASGLEAQLWAINFTGSTEAIQKCTQATSPTLYGDGSTVLAIGGLLSTVQESNNEAKSKEVALGGVSSAVCRLDLRTRQWDILSELPAAVAGPAIRRIGRFILVAFGYSGTTTTRVMAVDIVSGEATTLFEPQGSNFRISEGRYPFSSWPIEKDWLEAATSLYDSFSYPNVANKMVAPPPGVMHPLCGGSSTKWVCWGGFSAQVNAQLTGLTTVWPGIFLVTISQNLPEIWSNATFHSIEAAVPAVNLGLQQAANSDLRCQSVLSLNCGSLAAALSRFSAADSAIFHREESLRLQISIITNILSPPAKVEAPTIITGKDSARPTVVCSPVDVDGILPFSPWLSSFSSPTILDDVALAKEILAKSSIPCLEFNSGVAAVTEVEHVAFQSLQSLVQPRVPRPNVTSSQVILFPAAQLFTSSLVFRHVTFEGFGYLYDGADEVPREDASGIAPLRGGCVGAYESLLKLEVTRLTGCQAYEGGAVYISGGSLLASASQFSGNAALQNGGGISLAGGTAELDRCFVGSNQIGSIGDGRFHHEAGIVAGGGVYCFDSDSFILNASAVDNNLVEMVKQQQSLFYGGGLGLSHCYLEAISSNITNNLAGSGAGIFASSSQLELENFNCIGNLAHESGGGIYLDSGAASSFRNGVIERNIANSSDGGGMAVSNPREAVSLHNTSIILNAAERHGGGMAVLGLPPSTTISEFIIPDAVVIERNFAGGGGGGLYFTNGGIAGPEWTPSSISFDGNKGKYGLQYSTEPRRISIINEQVVTTSTFKTNTDLFDDRLPVLQILDAFNETITLNTEDVLQLAHVQDPGCPCTSELAGRTFVDIAEGIARLSEIRLLAAHDCCVRLTITLPQVHSVSIALNTSPCVAGEYVEAESLSCLLCPSGQYSREENQNACVLCPGGSATDGEGSIACMLCQPGTYSLPGSSSCTPCEDGKYSGWGWEGCLGCPEGALCENGLLYFLPDSWVDVATAGKGTPMIEGLQPIVQALAASASPCVPSLNAVASALQQTPGFQGLAWPEASKENITWPAADLYGITHSTSVIPCVFQGACELPCRSGIPTCGAGYHGPLCAACANGYFRWVDGCNECAGGAASYWAQAVLMSISLLVLFITMAIQGSGVSAAFRKGLLREFIVFLHSLLLLSHSTAKISSAHTDFLRAMDLASLFSLQLEPLLCLGDWSTLGKSIFWLVAIMLVYVLAFLTSCFKSKFSSGVRNAGLVLLHCLFFPVLWQAFQTFRVIPTPISGKDASTTYILADDGVTVVASSPEYTALVVITLFLVGMAVGLAGYLALSLWQRRRLQQQQSAHFMNIPEYLRAGLHGKAPASWNISRMLKFALGTVVISLVQNSIQELVMLTAVYHTFAAAFWAFSPFDTWQLRILASLSDAVPAITIVFTMLAVLYPGQSGLLGPLSIAMIGFVMAAFILLLVFPWLWRCFKCSDRSTPGWLVYIHPCVVAGGNKAKPAFGKSTPSRAEPVPLQSLPFQSQGHVGVYPRIHRESRLGVSEYRSRSRLHEVLRGIHSSRKAPPL